MKFLLGEKKEMTQVFDDKGAVSPATIISAGPAVVTQVKTKEKDGYESVQVGFGTRKEKRVSKAVKGHTKELGNFKVIKEFRGEPGDFVRGAKIKSQQKFARRAGEFWGAPKNCQFNFARRATPFA